MKKYFIKTVYLAIGATFFATLFAVQSAQADKAPTKKVILEEYDGTLTEEQIQKQEQEKFENTYDYAQLGNPQAQYELADLYYYGIGTKADFKQFLYWLKAAAKNKYTDAQADLGFMYYQGEGIEQDYQKAFHLLRQAAELGNAEAQKNLAYMFYFGHGIGKIHSEAVKWIKRAAERGNIEAQNHLEDIISEKLEYSIDMTL